MADRHLGKQVRLSEEQAAALTDLSQRTGFPVSELVRACIQRALPYVAARANGTKVLLTPNTAVVDFQHGGQHES